METEQEHGSIAAAAAQCHHRAKLMGDDMRIQLLAAAAFTVAIAASAQAQPLEQASPSIVVRTEASVEAPAEWVGLSWRVRGEGRSAVDAMKAMNVTHERVKSGLAALPGMTRLTAETSDLSVSEVRGDKCGDDGGDESRLSTGACAVVGYLAEIRVDAVIAPAARVGDAASLANELGARTVQIRSGGIDHPEQLADRAAKAALDKAHHEAQVLAAASGGRLGRVIRIQDARFAEERIQLEGTTRVEDLLNALPQAMVNPSAPVKLTPPPVVRRADFVVVYALDR